MTGEDKPLRTGRDEPSPRPGRSRTPLRRRGRTPVSKKRRKGPRSFHFGAGAALSHTMSCLVRNFPVFSLFALIVFLPQALWLLSHTEGALAEAQSLAQWTESVDFWERLDVRSSGIVGLLGQYSLPVVLQAVLTVAVFQFLSGSRVDYGKSFRLGVRNFFSVVGVALLVAGMIIALMVVLGLLVLPLLSGAGLAVLTIFGLALALLAVMIQCIFFVAIPAAVAEGRSPGAAMARSAWLTGGARWKILGILLLFSLGAMLVVYLLHMLLGSDPQTLASARLYVVLSVAVTAILSLFQAVATAVVYHDLRRAKEGVGVEELVRVFD